MRPAGWLYVNRHLPPLRRRGDNTLSLRGRSHQAARKPRTSRSKRGGVEARPEAVTVALPSVAGPALPNDPEIPGSPTLIETGDSGVEVRPNPASNPPHVRSGVIAHVPPEVRHQFVRDGPVRA
jgi:hypothetical protein